MAQRERRVGGIAGGETVSRDNAWAVVLARGDGTRLKSLTKKIAGDCRPKHFCQIYGGKKPVDPHTGADTCTSGRRVCQFRHYRELRNSLHKLARTPTSS